MHVHKRRLLPWLALLTVYIVWGSTYAAIRVVVYQMPPATAACVRFLGAGVVMVGLAMARGLPRPSRRQILGYSIVGVLMLGVGNALVMWAERRIDSGIAALIVATVPLWMALLDRLRPGGQPLRLSVLLGAVFGLGGVALVARPSGGLHAGHLGGALALQGASLAWAMGSIYAKTLPRLHAVTSTAIQMLAGAAALGLEAFARGEHPSAILAASPAAWLALLYLVAFGSLLAFTAYSYCLSELPATTVGTYAYVNPVVAVLLGWALFHEPLSASLLLGGGLIAVGVVLSSGLLR